MTSRLFETRGYSIKECYKIGKVGVSLHGNMREARHSAASIVLGDKLWVLGGWNGNRLLASSEYILHDGSREDGRNMPMALGAHAAIKINETHSMVIGGNNNGGYSARTWFYEHLTGHWSAGPNLLRARRHLSAGLITDSVTLETFIVVTGGYNPNGIFDTVEILDKQGTAWIWGKLS